MARRTGTALPSFLPWIVLGLVAIGFEAAGAFQTPLLLTPWRGLSVPGDNNRGRILISRQPRGIRGPSMILPSNPLGSEFEEAEDLADRLFRKYKKEEAGDKDKTGDSAWGKTTVEVTLKKPLGLTLIEVPKFGVYVQSVSEGSAKEAGVKRGDRIVATSSTVGGQMWEKNSLEGVLAAVQSGTILGKSMRFRLERDAVLSSIVGFTSTSEDIGRIDLQRAISSVERARIRVQDTATETFELTLPIPGREMRKLMQGDIFTGDMPYGLQLVQFPEPDGTTRVEVFDVLEGGTAATSGLLRKGDRVIAAQGSVGDMMWPKTTIQGLQTAVRTRMSGNSIRLRFERTVNLGTWEEQSLDVLQSDPENMAGYFTTGGAAVGVASKRGGNNGVFTGAGLNTSTLATSLSILPSKESWSVIQDIRQFHDRQARLWPPHVSLIKPFVRADAFLDASQILSDALQGVEPFSIKLRLETYQHHARCVTVWLVPDKESLAKVQNLENFCREVFPQCKAAPAFLDFAPHLTLGQFETEGEAKTLMALVQDRFKEFEISVNHVYLLSRPDKGSQSVQQVRVLLGRNKPSLSQALQEYADLRRTGADLNNTRTRSVLLERCCFDVISMGKSNDVNSIEALVCELDASGVEVDPKLLNLLMMAFIDSSRPDLAIKYFQQLTGIALKEQDSTWGPAGDVAQELERKRSPSSVLRFVEPNVMCCTTMIKALGRDGKVESAFNLLGYMVRNAIAPNIRTVNTLLEACVKNGDMHSAQQLFATLKGERGEGFVQVLTPESEEGVAIAVKPTEVSFNIMVNGFARQKQPDKAFKMLLEMRKAKCKPDRITYTTLLKACVASGQMERAESLIDDMRQLELQPDRFCYNTILQGLARQQQWEQALQVLKDMEVEDRVRPDLFSYSHAISACVRAGKVRAAERTFNILLEQGIVPNVNVYSTMMAGYGSAGLFYEAQELMKEMQQRRVKPNEYTFTSLAEAFTNAGMTDEALKVYSKMEEAGWSQDPIVKTLLVRILVMKNDFTQAFEVIEQINSGASESKQRVNLVIAWNAILEAAIKKGDREMCTKTLKAMFDKQVKPNRNTYLFISRESELSGYKRVDFFLMIVGMFRDAGHTPMGPLYMELVRSALKANDAQTAALQVKDRVDKKFLVSKVDADEARMLEERVSNRMRLDVQGTWFDETVKRGSIGSSSLDWDDEWDQWGPGEKRSKYTRAEQ